MNLIKLNILILLTLILVLLYFEYNTKFSIKNSLVLDTPNTLNVISHNFEHKDILIIFNIFKKLKGEYYILFADKLWNYLLEFIKPSNLHFIYIKGNTVNKLSELLLDNKNVILFLYEENYSTGVYHILKNTSCKLNLLSIKNNNSNNTIKNHYNSSFLDIYINNFNNKYNVKIKKIKSYNLNVSPQNFMDYLKYTLYK